jgi:hypothetical protein
MGDKSTQSIKSGKVKKIKDSGQTLFPKLAIDRLMLDFCFSLDPKT